MDDKSNLKIYRTWAPIYDSVMRPVYGVARRRAIELLNLQVGEKVLIPGVGTGLDLPLIPAGVHVTGIDLNQAMLEKARTKVSESNLTLAVMNAQDLKFPDDTFDVVILNLILSVVPDGAITFREAWRVLKPGGRVVIFDKFLPEVSHLLGFRVLLGWMIRQIGTDPNRRLSDLIEIKPDLVVDSNETSLLRGQYRIIMIHKKRKN